MEVASPAGIPVAPLSQPADGHITIPPNDIEMVDLYNPATLSYDAMWYAVNPSYDWLFCMAKYCALAGIITFCVAPLTTKNSPQKKQAPRLARKYPSSAPTRPFGFGESFTRRARASFATATMSMSVILHHPRRRFRVSFLFSQVCRSDVATDVRLDPARDIPPVLDGTLLEGCMQRTEYNLWVESMEYYDELNIAITVRRGTIQALYNIMASMDGKENGYVVFYFLNSQNMSMVREHRPWTSLYDSSEMPVVSGTGVLCPALRFLPSLGTFFAESAAAMVYSMKFAVNVVANPFAINEILINRSLPFLILASVISP